MFEQLVDGVRKASESSLHLQQEMFKQWTRMWMSAAPGQMSTSASPMDWNRASHKRWLELGLEMLNKQREAFDSMYKAGIEIIAQTFNVGEARSAEDYRRIVEDLWRKLFDLQKGHAENQFRDFQAWFEKSAALAQHDLRS